MWIDICSMRLDNHQWRARAYRITPMEERFLSSEMLEDVSGRLGRYIRGLQFNLLQGSCNVCIFPTAPQDGIGCRMIGTILYQLAVKSSGVEHLPTDLYFQAGECPFQLRSLLTLSYLCTAQRRRTIYDNYFHIHTTALPKETASDYEKRVVIAF